MDYVADIVGVPIFPSYVPRKLFVFHKMGGELKFAEWQYPVVACLVPKCVIRFGINSSNP